MKGSIRKIVVAMDNSDYSVTAACWGAHLAAAAEAELLLVHVVDVRYVDGPWFADICGAIGAAPYEQVVQNLTTAMTERGNNILAMGTELCRERGVTAKSLLLKGLFTDVIRDVTQDANLLILGRRGDDYSTGNYLIGTAGERAIRQVACCCLVVPREYVEPSIAVVGVNDSGPSRSACRWAEYIHQLLPGIEIRPVHVKQPGETGEAFEDMVADQPVITREGDPEEVLVNECLSDPEHTICLIGATGHTRTLKELILGTLTFHVLHQLTCPVLIAR